MNKKLVLALSLTQSDVQVNNFKIKAHWPKLL